MANLLKMTLPAYVVSYLIFYFLYKQLDMEKLIHHKTGRIVICILIGLLVYLGGLSITDSFNATKTYHSLFTGLFLGPTIACIPFIMPVNNVKNKS